MRRSLLLLVCAAALLAGACSPTVKRTPDGAPIAAAEPVPVVIWSSRDLPKELHAKVKAIEGVRWVTRVSNGMVDLIAVTGAALPLPRRAKGAVLPTSIGAMDPSPDDGDVVAAALAAGDAVISETAARLRGMSAGNTFTLAAEGVKRKFRVGAVVPDDDARGREILIPFAHSKGLGLTAPRALISSVIADRVGAAVATMQALTEGVRARIRSDGQDDAADEGASQILNFMEIKEIFGEFTYRPTSSRFVIPDRAWEDANIVETRIPLLGLLKCNKRILPQLNGAMRELIARGLGGLIRTSNGCYSPRMQVGNNYALSRHAYGIAVDVNATRNPFGETPSQDPRLVEVMERWGFTWGGRWIVPDGMHFEFVRFVDPASPPPIAVPSTAPPSSAPGS
ncbi:MAG: M15 family metallopeptidase [Actinomycetota bacterium]